MHFELDPATGKARHVSSTVIGPAGDDRIVVPLENGKQKTYEIQPDGTFDVPVEVAERLTRMPGWHEGASPFASV